MKQLAGVLTLITIACILGSLYAYNEIKTETTLLSQPTPTPSPDPVDEGVKAVLIAVAGQVEAGTEAIEQDTEQSGAPYRTITIIVIVAAVGIVGYLLYQIKELRTLVTTSLNAATAGIGKPRKKKEKPIKDKLQNLAETSIDAATAQVGQWVPANEETEDKQIL